VVYFGPNAVNISGHHAVVLGPNAVQISGPVVGPTECDRKTEAIRSWIGKVVTFSALNMRRAVHLHVGALEKFLILAKASGALGSLP
jgi:hypothetical protein